MTTRPGIAEIKEYLEIIPIFRGEAELLTLFITESAKVINYFYDPSKPNDPKNDFITSRIRAKIQGDAALYIANKNIATWDDLKRSLINAYSDRRDDATLTIELTKLTQGVLSPFEFYRKVQKILNAQITFTQLNYNADVQLIKHFNRLALKVFLNGLRDPLGSLMRTKDPEDLDSALNLLTNVYQKETCLLSNPKFLSNNKTNFNSNQKILTPFSHKPQFNQSKQNFKPKINFNNTNRNDIETPMSVSTSHTQNKIQPLQKRKFEYNNLETQDSDDEQNEECTDETFLEEEASEGEQNI